MDDAWTTTTTTTTTTIATTTQHQNQHWMAKRRRNSGPDVDPSSSGVAAAAAARSSRSPTTMTIGGTSGSFGGRRLSYEDYEVAWIVALPLEMAAGAAMLDEIHPPLPVLPGDGNSYTLGALSSGLNVAIACPPSVPTSSGSSDVATLARNVQRTFTRIRIALVVGISGGVPDRLHALRLGDVVVGERVVQHDFGRPLSLSPVNGGGGGGTFNQQHQQTSLVTGPPPDVLSAVAKLRSEHEARESNGLVGIMDEMLRRNQHMAGYGHPGEYRDTLFMSDYEHNYIKSDCDGCDRSRTVPRPPRRRNYEPTIHYGVVASGTQPVRDSYLRAKLAHELDAICVDTGVVGHYSHHLPCLVIRGICDYSDSHVNKEWQRYAAATAAAYAKSYLDLFSPTVNSLRQLSPQHLSPHQVSPQTSPPQVSPQLPPLGEALAFQDIDHRYLDIKPAHYGTCNWFRDDAIYRSWQDPERLPFHGGFLWICGKPGAGKSTLMKNMFEDMKRCSRVSDTVISFFFHARGSQLQRSIEGLYRSLIYQILLKYPVLEKDLSQSVRGKMNLDLTLKQLQGMLTDAILQIGCGHGSSRITFFIDALDECNDEEIRNMVTDFEDRGRMAASHRHGIQLYTCFASRHYPQIVLERGLRMTLEGQYGHDQDLAKYVDSMLRTGGGSSGSVVGGGDAHAHAHQIKRQIIEKSQSVFLWVVLVVAMLNKEFQRGRSYAVQQRLEQIPTELHDLFDHMLSQGGGDDDDDSNSKDNAASEFRLCIQWLLFARRPLRYREYYFAVVSGLDAGADILQSMDASFVTDDQFRRFVVSSSRGLAEISGDSDGGTVQFIHQSVPDYLLDRQQGRGLQHRRRPLLWPAIGGASFTALSHEQLKECCFTYIRSAAARLERCMDVIQRAPREHRRDLVDEAVLRFPFLSYVFGYMLFHADAANSGSTTPVPQREFLQALDSSWFRVMDHVAAMFGWEMTWSPPDSVSNPPTLSYRLASSNMASLMATLPVEDLKLAVRGGPLGYPLSVAISFNCLDAVKIILDADVYYSSNTKTPPPSCCPRCGRSHHPICQIPSYKLSDTDGETPLGCAVARKQDAIVDLLLAVKDIDVNAKNTQGDTPLIMAMRQDRDDVVARLLQSRRVSINARHGIEEYTPLMEAVRVSSTRITELLLAVPGIDVNARTRMSKSALSLACERGAGEIVSLLLRRGNVTINATDGRGKTPLLAATISNHACIVKMLLECPGINVDVQDNEGHTAYSWGTKYAHSSIQSLFHAFRPVVSPRR